MKRKVVSLMLVSAMVAGMLAGCGSDSGSSKGGSSTETGSAAEASSSGETADDADDKSPITFEYFNADGKNGNWDNPVAKAITEATGVTLDVSYPVASQGDAKEDVALMIANDEYPDMIYAKGSATDLYQAGALIDMTDLIEKYGPNIKKMYGAEMEKLKWSQDDPGIYQLSYAGVNQKTLTTGGSCQIQWAALKENDYKYPKTLDEYEKMIKSYLAAHPKTEDGLDMIGITMSASDWHWMITLGNPAGLIADASPDNGQWIIDDEYNVHYKHVTDEEKEYFKWLCRMYNEGILDPNFATQTDDDYIAKVASGRVVAITDAEWHYSQCEATLVADGKVDQTYVGLPVTLREDQVEKALLYQGTTVGWGIGITKSCEDPVRASNSLTICAPMKDRSCITGVLKARTTSSMMTDSHIVPMKKLQKLSLIRIMQRIPVLTTTLDSRSTEQVPTLKTDSHTLQLPKSLLLQTTIQQKKKDAKRWDLRC